MTIPAGGVLVGLVLQVEVLPGAPAGPFATSVENATGTLPLTVAPTAGAGDPVDGGVAGDPVDGGVLVAGEAAGDPLGLEDADALPTLDGVFVG